MFDYEKFNKLTEQIRAKEELMKQYDAEIDKIREKEKELWQETQFLYDEQLKMLKDDK
jgi:hypothetical protein